MNRNDLQRLAGARIREAKALFKAGEYSGAYYLAGYAIECALKACYARRIKRHDFPERKVREIFTHDLQRLIILAGLKDEWDLACETNSNFEALWDLICKWTEESRYSTWTRNEAEALLDAITGRKDGVLRWIKRYW
jgi:HEPN domain-containing protein